jgi:hypothetical protein
MPGFSYDEVAAAIKSLHAVPPGRETTFRSRVRHLQRLGLLPGSPRRGIKIEYGIADAWRWAVCFSLIQTGLPPDAVKSVLGVAGRKLALASAGDDAPSGKVWGIDEVGNRQPFKHEDRIFWLRAEFLTWHLDDPADWFDRVRFNVIPISLAAAAAFQREESGQVIMLNLTKLKRDLFAALKIESETNVSAQASLADC